MDLDDLDGPSQAPRTSKFLPGKGLKSKLKPKPEPSSKPEHAVQAEKTELPVNAASLNTGIMDLNDTVKMDIETKEESRQDDPMDEDSHEQNEEESNTIAREIDVYLTPAIDDLTKLYVLQYPLRPSWRPYDLDDTCEEVRVKPVSMQMEVDLSVDTNSTNYDRNSNLKISKRTLRTSWDPRGASSDKNMAAGWKPPRGNCYAVGILIGNKLHVNPIEAVVQFRPSMEHLSSGEKSKNATLASAEGTFNKEETKEVKAAGSLKKQSKPVESPTEKKPDNEESWVPLKYHPLQSDFYSQCLKKMTKAETNPLQFSMTQTEYLNSISPCGSSNNNTSSVTSKRVLLSMPLDERFQKLLCEGPQFRRFSALKHYAPDSSNEDVLKVLQQHALLVQGLWTPKTKLLKLESILALARDYFLVLFSKDLTIHSSKVTMVGGPKDRVKVKEIINTLARERPCFDSWKLREIPDGEFVKQHPDIVKKQDEIWKTMEEKLFSIIRGAKGAAGGRKSEKPMDSKVPHGRIVSDDSKVPHGRIMSDDSKVAHGRIMSDDTRNALPQALKQVFQKYKICSFQLIREGLRDLAVSKSNNPKAFSSKEKDAALAADAPQEQLQEFISQVATNIHGSYVLKSCPDHPEYDPLRFMPIPQKYFDYGSHIPILSIPYRLLPLLPIDSRSDVQRIMSYFIRSRTFCYDHRKSLSKSLSLHVRRINRSFKYPTANWFVVGCSDNNNLTSLHCVYMPYMPPRRLLEYPNTHV